MSYDTEVICVLEGAVYLGSRKLINILKPAPSTTLSGLRSLATNSHICFVISLPRSSLHFPVNHSMVVCFRFPSSSPAHSLYSWQCLECKCVKRFPVPPPSTSLELQSLQLTYFLKFFPSWVSKYCHTGLFLLLEAILLPWGQLVRMRKHWTDILNPDVNNQNGFWIIRISVAALVFGPMHLILKENSWFYRSSFSSSTKSFLDSN